MLVLDFLKARLHQVDKAMDAFERDPAFHPDNEPSYMRLMGAWSQLEARIKQLQPC